MGQVGGLLTDLDNLFSHSADHSADQYPKDLVEAHRLLVDYQPPRSHIIKQPPDKSKVDPPDLVLSKLTFMQIGATIPGTDGVLHLHIQCFACKNKGHYSNACPKDKEVWLFQMGTHIPGRNINVTLPMDFTFTSMGAREVAIPKTWVLLDSQLTISVFCSKDLLTHIRPCTVPLKVLTNGGKQVSHFVGGWRSAQFWHHMVHLMFFGKYIVAGRSAVQLSSNHQHHSGSMSVHRVDGVLWSSQSSEWAYTIMTPTQTLIQLVNVLADTLLSSQKLGTKIATIITK